MIMVYKSLPGR